MEPPCGSMVDDELGRKPALVRTDEAVIVFLVLCFWMAVIAMFCHKWGKIRHLEPYQPQYHAEEPTPFPSPVYSIHPKPVRSNTYRTSAQLPGQFSMAAHSRLNMNTMSFDGRRRTYSQGSRMFGCGGSLAGQKPLFHYASACVYQHHSPTQSRKRMNSLFAGCSNHNHRNSLLPEPLLKRKIKSAEDIKTLFVQMTSKATSPQHRRNRLINNQTPSLGSQYQHHPPRHPNTMTIDDCGLFSLDQSEASTIPILRDTYQMVDCTANESLSMDSQTVDRTAHCSMDNPV